MKILFIDQFAEIGGAQRCLLDLLPEVRKRGWMTQAAIPGDGPFVAALSGEGVQVHPIRCGPYGFGSKSAADVARFGTDFPRLARRIAGLAEQFKPDIVYVNGPRVLPAAAWACRNRAPLLFHSHSRLSAAYAALAAGNSLRLANATAIACCRYVAEPLEDYLPPRRLHVIYNGVARCSQRGRRPGEYRVGVVGRIAPQKGQAEFIEAARILVGAGVPCRFVLCGAPMFADEGYFEQVRKLAEGLPVEFAGWRNDVCEVLAGLDVLVVPSLAGEPGAPRVVLEAYAAGVPVIAFRSGGIPEIVAHGHTGLLVESPTPAALAKAIREIIAEPRTLERMANAATTAWRERHTVERYRKEVLDVIEGVIARTGAAGARTAAPQ